MANPIVLGYYASWNTAVTPDKLDFRLFTHITHAFASVDAKGNLKTPEERASRDLVSRAHTAKTKVILALGGADSNTTLTAVAATPDGVKQLVDAMARVAETIGYDGIDVDWEAPENATDGARMNAVVKALRQRMPKAILTMAVPAGDWAGKWYQRDALLPYIDTLNVMTYDFHGPWSDHAGYNAPLFPSKIINREGRSEATDDAGSNGAASMDYWLKTKGWPREKLLFGIPLYGRGFRAAKIGDPARGSFDRSELSYRDVLGLIKAGWHERWDEAAQVPYLEKTDGTEVFSYDDPRSVKLKGAFARERGLAGYFFWEIAQDFDGRTNPLVRAARDGWG
jgi:chitinase